MTRPRWYYPNGTVDRGQHATRVAVVEAVERTAPTTKAELADAVDISEEYLSEVLGELKSEGVVSKAYVVDDEAVYEAAATRSPLAGGDGSQAEQLVERLEGLDAAVTAQYRAARRTVAGEEPDDPPAALASVADERYREALGELKSYTMTTDWPGDRVAADLATVATRLALVGERARFVADAVDGTGSATRAAAGDRLLAAFAAGDRVHETLTAVLFDAEVSAVGDLSETAAAARRELRELFEVATAYDPAAYGHLVSVTRALEAAVCYWAAAVEVAARLHAGTAPEVTPE